MSVAIIVMIHKSQVLGTKHGWRWSPEILLAGVLVKANKKQNFTFVEWSKLILILMLPLLLLETDLVYGSWLPDE